MELARVVIDCHTVMCLLIVLEERMSFEKGAGFQKGVS